MTDRRPLRLQEYILEAGPAYQWLRCDAAAKTARVVHDHGMEVSALVRARGQKAAGPRLLAKLYASETDGQYAMGIAADTLLAVRRGVLLDVRGKRREGVGECFAAACFTKRRLGLLRMVLELGPPPALRGAVHGLSARTQSAWVDFLCTVDPSHGLRNAGPSMHLAQSSLWEVAAVKGSDAAAWRAGFELALDFQPGHADVERVLAEGGERAAVVAALIMERRLSSETRSTPPPPAPDSASASLPLCPPRRRMVL